MKTKTLVTTLVVGFLGWLLVIGLIVWLVKTR